MGRRTDKMKGKHMLKKRYLVAAVFAVAGFLGLSAPPAALAAGYGNVVVNESNGNVTIGNNAISRTFSTAAGKLKTVEINNKLASTTLVPGSGSEEFVIQSLAEATRLEPAGALTSVRPTAVTVAGSSVDTSEAALASKAIDGDAGTYWASSAEAAGTANLIVDFGGTKTIASVSYTPRHHESVGYNCTGRVKTYKLEYQMADGTWATLVENGTMNDTGTTVIKFAAVQGKAVRLTGLTTYHWQPSNENKYMNVAELDVLDASDNSVVHGSKGWTVTGTSVATNEGGGYEALVDGDFTTYYHSRYGAGEGDTKKLPVDLTIDRGEGAKSSFQTVGYAGRNVKGANGTFKKFAVYVSDSKDGLFDDSNKKGTFSVDLSSSYNDDGTCKMTYFGLDKAQTGRYVGIRVLEAQGGSFASGAELDLYQEKFDTFENASGKPQLKTSNLELDGPVQVSDTTATINDVKKSGKMLTFTFKPVQFGNGLATVTEKIVMYDGDHFMRKFLEVKSEDKDIRFDYIDGEHLNVKDAGHTWTIPTGKGGVVEMTEARANLGQPIYVNGMFMGSEFPETDTQIVDSLGRMRYWTGKSFNDFERDGQLTSDGKYVSWQTVVGATHSDGSNNDVVRTDFYSYIKSISKPSEFRIQYNSWFDNMMLIDENNILDSFKAVDKNLSATGVRPLDSYVVDDGWNNYNNTETSVDPDRSGTGKNTEGFWAFNSKFPNKLSTSSALVNKLGSNFGVWVGPRGGYNFYGQLADIISKAGNGSAAGGSIDVADQRYVDKFQELALQWMADYGVNYWKWDGYADNAQYNAFAQGEGVVGYDKNHHHMYGGPNGFYHSTDLWEKWIALFENVWGKADELGIDNLWVSLTCYVNPSPWFLQWSNSVWIQCTHDRGEVSNSTLDNKMDNMLSYRDGAYYDFVKNHDFQFPLSNLYNHDPIYGKEGTGITATSMDGAQFRNYLYMMATRGTSFWELYYSDSLFDDEKYLVNADFLKWAEENFDKLQNAKMIGGVPASGVKLGGISGAGTQEAYGFSCFNGDGDEGIISMRNPSASEKTITFKLDAGVGASHAGTFKRSIVESYTSDGGALGSSKDSYAQGDTVTVTLKPGETQIWDLSQKGDTLAPKLDTLYVKGAKSLRVQASEHVTGAKFTVTVDGKQVECEGVEASADMRTFDIKLVDAVKSGSKIEVTAAQGQDASGNGLEGSVSGAYRQDGIIASAEDSTGGKLSNAKDSVEGKNGFTVATSVSDATSSTVLLSQGDEWGLGIDKDGKAYFIVNGTTATSDVTVTGGNVTITGVRENNGMLKIYVDGELAGSAYLGEKDADHAVNADAITAGNGTKQTSLAVYDHALAYDEVPTSALAELIATVEAKRDSVSDASWANADMDTLLAQAKAALKGDAAAKKAAYDKLNAGYLKLVPANKIVNLALGKVPTAAWVDGDTATAVTNPDASRALTVATDGSNADANAHCIFGNDAKEAGSYMQIDLGSDCEITGVSLWRYWTDSRTYNATALVVASKPDFSDAQVLYYSGDSDVFGLGKDPKDSLYAETSAGKRLFDAANSTAAMTARYVRLYGSGVKGTGTSKENHVVELQVFGTVKQNDPYDLNGKNGLLSLIARAETAQKNADSYESVEGLTDPLKRAHDVIERIDAGQDVTYGEVKDAAEALKAALDALVVKAPAKKVTVTFDDGCGNKSTVELNEGGKLAKPADPTREGYDFAGWCTDKDGEHTFDFDSAVNADITLYAKWNKQQSGGSGSGSEGGSGSGGASTDKDSTGSQNKGDKKGTKADLPGTGDSSMFFAGLALCLGAAVIAASRLLKRRSER